MKSENFLKKLQKEAQLQAQLERNLVLPRGLGMIADFIGTYPWQFLLVISLVTTVGVSFL